MIEAQFRAVPASEQFGADVEHLDQAVEAGDARVLGEEGSYRMYAVDGETVIVDLATRLAVSAPASAPAADSSVAVIEPREIDPLVDMLLVRAEHLTGDARRTFLDLASGVAEHGGRSGGAHLDAWEGRERAVLDRALTALRTGADW